MKTGASTGLLSWRHISVLSRRVLKPRPVLDGIALGIVVIVIFTSIFGPMIAPSSAFDTDIGNAFDPPSWVHWFGTDDQGRDVFWRVILGTRVSVGSALLIVAGYAFISVLVATVASLGGRFIDSFLMGFCDVALAVPPMVAALGLAAALGPSLQSGIIAMILAGWTISARFLRVIMRQTMEMPFVNGAKVLGVSRTRLMTRHVLPHSLDNLIVKWAADIGSTIVALAALSFIGVGAQPPSPEWGAMIANSQGYMATAWWTVTMPGLALVITAAAFGLLGDMLASRHEPSRGIMPTFSESMA